MIDNVDQDEWFNLYLYLGSCWVNKSRYEARYDTRYNTGYESGPEPELRSLDQLIELRIKELNKRSLDTKVELNPDVWGPGLLLNQFRITFWRRISSWTISSIFIIYQINLYCLTSHGGSVKPLKEDQNQFVVSFRLRTDRPGFFKSQYFKSDNR
jgi:hypothetical protein